MDLTSCPECGLPAEVVERDAWPSTDGPVEHATVRCVDRHRFVMPVASLPAAPVTSRRTERLRVEPLVRVRRR